MVKGIPTPKDVLGYHVGTPKRLTKTDAALAYYRALEKASPRIRVTTIGKTDEGRDVTVVYIANEATLKKLATHTASLGRLADPRGLSEAEAKRLIAIDAADVPPDGGAAQCRDRPARDADGTRLPPGGERHASHPPDSRPGHRQLHARERPGRPRSLRRLVPQAHGGHHRGEEPDLRAAVLGQVHLSRQQPRHQLLAGDDARAPRVVPEDASAGHARPARVGAVPLYLLRARPRRTRTSTRSSTASCRRLPISR